MAKLIVIGDERDLNIIQKRFRSLDVSFKLEGDKPEKEETLEEKPAPRKKPGPKPKK